MAQREIVKQLTLRLTAAEVEDMDKLRGWTNENTIAGACKAALRYLQDERRTAELERQRANTYRNILATIREATDGYIDD